MRDITQKILSAFNGILPAREARERNALAEALHGAHELPNADSEERYTHGGPMIHRLTRIRGLHLYDDIAELGRLFNLGMPQPPCGERELLLWARRHLIGRLTEYARRPVEGPFSVERQDYTMPGRPFRGATEWVKLVRPSIHVPATFTLDYEKIGEEEHILPHKPSGDPPLMEGAPGAAREGGEGIIHTATPGEAPRQESPRS